MYLVSGFLLGYSIHSGVVERNKKNCHESIHDCAEEAVASNSEIDFGRNGAKHKWDAQRAYNQEDRHKICA